ncbi:TPA: hypothetical protein I8Y35_000498 [Klebsiella oxytoca]|nr:hypothetical protein [Klebsiella oxytoca]
MTELAQSLKAAAENATPGEWCSDDLYGIVADAGLNGNYYIASCSGPEHRSNKRFIALANPANILALVEALEKAKTEIEKWHRMANRLGEQLEESDRLDSRTVTIEPFRSFVTDADLAALHRFAECCDDPESGGHDLEKEQVRRLEAIGALQRSGRISYITGFGDFLISITAGIKWEAE